MKTKIIYAAIGVALVAVAWVIPSLGWMSSPSYEVPIQVLDNGGAESASESFINIGSLGQPTPLGMSQSTSYRNRAGYIEQLATMPVWCVCAIELDASYESGMLGLDFTINTLEPATWVNYLVLTYPSVQPIPLWTVTLPSICPYTEIPIAFPLPPLGWVGFWTGLITEEGLCAFDFIWVDTGWPNQ